MRMVLKYKSFDIESKMRSLLLARPHRGLSR
jgi:hypothetical protein